MLRPAPADAQDLLISHTIAADLPPIKTRPVQLQQRDPHTGDTGPCVRIEPAALWAGSSLTRSSVLGGRTLLMHFDSRPVGKAGSCPLLLHA